MTMKLHTQHRCTHAQLPGTCTRTHPFFGTIRPLWHGVSRKTSAAAHARQQAHHCSCSRHSAKSDTVEQQPQPIGNAKPQPRQNQDKLKTQVQKAASNNISIVAEIKPVANKLGTLWGLLVMAVAYVHHSTTGWVMRFDQDQPYHWSTLHSAQATYATLVSLRMIACQTLYVLQVCPACPSSSDHA